MRRFFPIVGWLLLQVCSTPGRVNAQSSDTIATTPTRYIEIVSERQPELNTLDPRPVTITPLARALEETGSYLAANILGAMSSSLDIRRYGTLGSVAFPSFRGLPAEYTIVYRDGLRLTNEQNSLTDLGQVSLRGAGTIELIPASSAVLLGGDAVGAAINVVSSTWDTAYIRLGSEQTVYQGASGIPADAYYATLHAQPNADLSLVAGGSVDRSSGVYPFRQSGASGPVMRENNDAHLANLYLNAAWQLPSKATTVNFFSHYFDIFRHLPGPATVPGRGASSLTASQTDRHYLGGLRIDHAWNDWSSSLAVNYQQQGETYTDDAYGTRDSSVVTVLGVTLNGLGIANRWCTIFGGADLLHTSLDGTTARSETNDSTISRDRLSAYIATKLTLLKDLSVSASLRAEAIAKLSPEFLPQITATYQVLSELQLSAAYSGSYHPPTLNELYWKGLGRQDLRSERGENWQAAIYYTPAWKYVTPTFGLTYFHAAIDDQIIWLPFGNSVHPVNISKVVSSGLELRTNALIELSSTATLRLEESYTLLSARDETPGAANSGKELQYTSPLSSLFSATLRHEAIGSIAVLMRYRGHRYTDPANTIEGRLNPVIVTDLVLRTREFSMGNIGGLVGIAVENLTNTSYEEVINYPMPGRSYKLSIELNYH